MLNKAGFNAGKVDGIFGKNTRNALIRFQRAKGIAVDGVAGIQTYNALINQLSAQAKKKAQKSTSSNQWTGQTLRIGSRGQAVKDLQSKLSKLGYNVGAIDGIYGKQTAAAVKSFQRTYGLSQDGIAGKNTYSAMNQALQRRNTYNKTTVIENRYKALENKVHNKNSTWNEVSKSLKDIAKMGFDFIIVDDIKTLLDPKAKTIDKVIAGLSFIPGGKVVNGAVKLAKIGRKVTIKVDKNFLEAIKNHPYVVAKNGGKHSGFYKQYINKSPDQIRKAINSIDKQIAEHKDKIKNPEKYIPNFKNLDPRQQHALIHKKWPADIQRQKEQKEILEGILRFK
jgi:peptidoglycan hydrolase-like protein with peptidoglycan-binding domain